MSAGPDSDVPSLVTCCGRREVGRACSAQDAGRIERPAWASSRKRSRKDPGVTCGPAFARPLVIHLGPSHATTAVSVSVAVAVSRKRRRSWSLRLPPANAHAALAHSVGRRSQSCSPRALPRASVAPAPPKRGSSACSSWTGIDGPDRLGHPSQLERLTDSSTMISSQEERHKPRSTAAGATELPPWLAFGRTMALTVGHQGSFAE